jgi:hypothetical protein
VRFAARLCDTFKVVNGNVLWTMLSGEIVQRTICVDLILSFPSRADALDFPLILKTSLNNSQDLCHIYCCVYLYKGMSAFQAYFIISFLFRGQKGGESRDYTISGP